MELILKILEGLGTHLFFMMELEPVVPYIFYPWLYFYLYHFSITNFAICLTLTWCIILLFRTHCLLMKIFTCILASLFKYYHQKAVCRIQKMTHRVKLKVTVKRPQKISQCNLHVSNRPPFFCVKRKEFLDFLVTMGVITGFLNVQYVYQLLQGLWSKGIGQINHNIRRLHLLNLGCVQSSQIR